MTVFRHDIQDRKEVYREKIKEERDKLREKSLEQRERLREKSIEQRDKLRDKSIEQREKLREKSVEQREKLREKSLEQQEKLREKGREIRERAVRENWYTIPNAISTGRIVLGKNSQLIVFFIFWFSSSNGLLHNTRSLRSCSVSQCGLHDLRFSRWEDR